MKKNKKNTANKKTGKSKSIKYWVGFAIVFAIAYAIAFFAGDSIVKIFNPEKTSEEILDQQWIKKAYGSFGLSVETPAEMSIKDLALTETVKQLIEVMDAYHYASDMGFKVVINSIKYQPMVEAVNLQAAAKGSANEMKRQPNITDLKYVENNVTRNNISGIIQKGTYIEDGVAFEYINVLFAHELVLWQVMVTYQVDDEVGKVAAARVIESIEINYN